jgi:membrane protein implicated in regulation of membrane protease activity
MVGLVLSLLAAIGLRDPDIRDTLLDLAALALVVSSIVFAFLLVEDLWVWWRWRRRTLRGPIYRPEGKTRAIRTRFFILDEAGLQQALATDPGLPRIGMEPPPDWRPPVA